METFTIKRNNEIMMQNKENSKIDVQGVRLRGRPRTIWMNNVKRAFNKRRQSVEQGRMIVRDRSEWRAVVNA